MVSAMSYQGCNMTILDSIQPAHERDIEPMRNFSRDCDHNETRLFGSTIHVMAREFPSIATIALTREHMGLQTKVHWHEQRKTLRLSY